MEIIDIKHLKVITYLQKAKPFPRAFKFSKRYTLVMRLYRYMMGGLLPNANFLRSWISVKKSGENFLRIGC